jgi:hypothetical protein
MFLVTHLDSALTQVFIPPNLKFFRMNTYEKPGGEGGIMVKQASDKASLS